MTIPNEEPLALDEALVLMASADESDSVREALWFGTEDNPVRNAREQVRSSTAAATGWHVPSMPMAVIERRLGIVVDADGSLGEVSNATKWWWYSQRLLLFLTHAVMVGVIVSVSPVFNVGDVMPVVGLVMMAGIILAAFVWAHQFTFSEDDGRP